jgi:hypothetical protein
VNPAASTMSTAIPPAPSSSAPESWPRTSHYRVSVGEHPPRLSLPLHSAQETQLRQRTPVVIMPTGKASVNIRADRPQPVCRARPPGAAK